MELKNRIRSHIKRARKRGSLWVRGFDVVRLAVRAEGRAILWTQVMHGNAVHQTTAYTCDDRYPALFDLAAALAPNAERILSFGCSTGEELVSLRRRFPNSDIIGVEINARSRGLAESLIANDKRMRVVSSSVSETPFDVIFALAVLQRQPQKIADMGVTDLSSHYPFERFDSAVRELFGILRSHGLLCITNAHYRVEDSSVAAGLVPIPESQVMEEPLFGPDGKLLKNPIARTIFRKG